MSGTTATLTTELDVSSGTARAAAPTYTDVSTSVGDRLSIRRGRTYELAQMDTGISTLAFDNADRLFDPTYTTGTYYPNLKPMRPLRLTVTISAVNYRIFTGYILEFPPVWEGPGWSYVTVRAADCMGVLALQDNLSAVFVQEKTGTRIGNVLDAISFPGANRVIDTGTSDCAAHTFVAADGQNALAHIRDVELTENGLFFFDGQGRAIFKSRVNQLIAQSTVKATFGDTGTDMGFEDAPGDYGDRLIYNSITVTDSANNATTKSDTTSQDAYWPRSLSRPTLLPSGSAEAADAANYLLATYKDPKFRFSSLTFMASLSDTLMTEAVTREIGDRITVKKTPPGGGAQISQDCIVQSITHEVHPGDDLVWYTTYELAPADSTVYWILGTVGASELGTTTRLGY